MDDISAAARVFAISELMSIIVDLVAEHGRLQSCGVCHKVHEDHSSDHGLSPSQVKFFRGLAVVGRNWSDAAIGKLWASQDLARLRNIAPGRRQYYAGKIRVLDMNLADDGLENFEDLNVTTPQLLSLGLHHAYRNDGTATSPRDPAAAIEPWMARLLSPSIHAIQLGAGFSHHTNLLRAIGMTCTNLTHLRARPTYNAEDSADMSGMLELLRVSRKLQSVRLETAGNFRLKNRGWYPMLSILAALPSLRELALPCGFPEAVAKEVDSSCNQSFPNLRTFDMECLPAFVAPTAPLLSNVREIYLRILSGPDVGDGYIAMSPVISPLTSLQNLEVLQISFQGNWTSLVSEDIMALSQLRGLRTLEVSSEGSQVNPGGMSTPTLRAPGLDFAVLQSILSNNPELRHLDLLVNHEFSLLPALKKIGSGCRQLESLRLHGELDFGDLQDPEGTPMFPKLERLEVGMVNYLAPERNLAYVQALYDKQLPALKWPICEQHERDESMQSGIDMLVEKWFEKRRAECGEE